MKCVSLDHAEWTESAQMGTSTSPMWVKGVRITSVWVAELAMSQFPV